MGVVFARLEGRIAFARLLSRTRSIELATDRPRWRPTLNLRALVELEISFGL